MPCFLLIYIPIWLDLLLFFSLFLFLVRYHLHSNMVRFIIDTPLSLLIGFLLFTFQYGQIYYYIYPYACLKQSNIYIPIWLDLLFLYMLLVFLPVMNLHSNMVRFIIRLTLPYYLLLVQFTFQYGQIYYFVFIVKFISVKYIYIPIWLDLL